VPFLIPQISLDCKGKCPESHITEHMAMDLFRPLGQEQQTHRPRHKTLVKERRR
jgi:hypothetical protein